MLVVDRQSFIAWSQGILLERDGSGHVVVGDDPTYEEVELQLAKGQRVYLAVNNEVVSYLCLTEGRYQEFEWRGKENERM